MQFHKYRSASLTSVLDTFTVHTAITQLFCNFHWSSPSLTTKLNQITGILRCPCQGAATLNMPQYRHYNKENENQCSTNVGRFILFESGAFFSAANITFEVKLNCPKFYFPTCLNIYMCHIQTPMGYFDCLGIHYDKAKKTSFWNSSQQVVTSSVIKWYMWIHSANSLAYVDHLLFISLMWNAAK